jgi:hypothetical protein
VRLNPLGGYQGGMDPGTFFLLIVLLVVIGGVVGFFALNAGILGSRGSDPERQLGPDSDGDPDERPRHTKVTLEQNTQDKPRGEPVDRVT